MWWQKKCPHCGGALHFLGAFQRIARILHCDDCSCDFYCVKRGLVASVYNLCQRKA